MKIDIYQIDAFADRVFVGNPAAVCPLDEWLDDSLMQSIAAENNLAETAFIVPLENQKQDFEIRWFTPEVEVDLCGHATLASAYLVFNLLKTHTGRISFKSRSGPLFVSQAQNSSHSDLLELDFPAQSPTPCDVPDGLLGALGRGVVAKGCAINDDVVVLLESESEVIALDPNFQQLAEVPARGVIVTAPSKKYDFVCRFFGPAVGVNEDHVTGSAFTKLVPYWAHRLGKATMHAKQVSPRGGEVFCELAGSRVKMAGKAVLYMQGVINV